MVQYLATDIPCRWLNTTYIKLHSGGSTIFQTGANAKGRGANLSFGQLFPENCMKMKEIGQRGARPLDLPIVQLMS